MIWFKLVYRILRGLQAILAICGNLLTIVAVWRYHDLQTPTNVFVVALAALDFLSGLILMPLSASVDLVGSELSKEYDEIVILHKFSTNGTKEGIESGKNYPIITATESYLLENYASKSDFFFL